MISLLVFGFLLGMRHTLEADHLAAVASMTSNSISKSQAFKQGAVWGLGHTATLLVFCSMALLLDRVISAQLAAALEFIVGIMLCGLGADVIYRLYNSRVHFHIHQHPNMEPHFHAHSHSKDEEHNDHDHAHSHSHVHGFPKRALYVGAIHGLAGSAALIVLTLQSVNSVATGIWYILLFGFGSVMGMASLSFVVAIPLRRSAKGLTKLNDCLHLMIGSVTIVIGIRLAMENLPI